MKGGPHSEEEHNQNVAAPVSLVPFLQYTGLARDYGDTTQTDERNRLLQTLV